MVVLSVKGLGKRGNIVSERLEFRNVKGDEAVVVKGHTVAVHLDGIYTVVLHKLHAVIILDLAVFCRPQSHEVALCHSEICLALCAFL